MNNFFIISAINYIRCGKDSENPPQPKLIFCFFHNIFVDNVRKSYKKNKKTGVNVSTLVYSFFYIIIIV